jgi:hypothetical protein
MSTIRTGLATVLLDHGAVMGTPSPKSGHCAAGTMATVPEGTAHDRGAENDN